LRMAGKGDSNGEENGGTKHMCLSQRDSCGMGKKMTPRKKWTQRRESAGRKKVEGKREEERGRPVERKLRRKASGKNKLWD